MPFALIFTIIVGIFLLSLWSLWVAALPAAAVDEVIYHLEIPKQMDLVWGLPAFDNNIYGSFPQLGECLFFLGRIFSGEQAGKLIHASSAVMLALALYGFGRNYLSPWYAFLSVTIFLTTPVVMSITSIAYVDLMFGLFTFLA